MSQDYSGTKPSFGNVYPLGARDTSSFQRLEPILTADLLKSRFLFGIPMVSALKNPITGERAKLTDEMLKDLVSGAIVRVEAEVGVTIMPTQFDQKLPFDRNEYLSFGFLKLPARPVSSIDGMWVTPANNENIFTVPLEWVDVGALIQGQVNLIPIGIVLAGSSYGTAMISGTSGGAAAFLAILGNQYWIPAYWRVKYTAGYPNGLVPRFINDLVGIYAAIEVLGMLGATHAPVQSSSLGVDGLSQSVSTPGPNVYATRLQQLEDLKHKLIKTARKQAGMNFIVGNI